jgi:hypothetical protein
MVLTVTFDTNALNDVLSPETSQRGEQGQREAAKVRAAIQAGLIRGFFPETIITLEGVQRKDRSAVFGSTRLQSESTSTDANTITISIGVVQDRKPLDLQLSSKIQAASSLGLRALRAPARAGSVRVKDEDGTFFAPDASTLELLARMEKVNKMASAISKRGLGYAKAVELGRKDADCDNPFRPQLWLQGLADASNRQVKLAINEWADGDAVASHYGYGRNAIGRHPHYDASLTFPIYRSTYIYV